MAVTGGAGTTAARADTAVLRAVLHILFGPWGLGVSEAAAVLGGVSPPTLLRWRKDPAAADLDPAMRLRLSRLLALHRALRAAFPDAAAQRAWLHRPLGDCPRNPESAAPARYGPDDPDRAPGEGRSPLDVLRQGRLDDIAAVQGELPSRPT